MHQARFGRGGFLHEVEASSDADGLHPGVDLELLETTGNVIADGGAADEQLLSDFVGAVPGGKVAQPRMLAAEAVHLMETYRITSLPVVSDDGERRLVGALNVHDLLRAGVM